VNTSLVILRDKRKYEFSVKLRKKKEKVLTKFEVGLPECNFGKAWSQKKKVGEGGVKNVSRSLNYAE